MDITKNFMQKISNCIFNVLPKKILSVSFHFISFPEWPCLDMDVVHAGLVLRVDEQAQGLPDADGLRDVHGLGVPANLQPATGLSDVVFVILFYMLESAFTIVLSYCKSFQNFSKCSNIYLLVNHTPCVYKNVLISFSLNPKSLFGLKVYTFVLFHA